MSKNKFIPPISSIREYVPKNLTTEDLEKIQNINAKNSKAYARIEEKYIKPIRKREKELKRIQRNEWLWTKGATLLNTILALIAAITGIISLLR